MPVITMSNTAVIVLNYNNAADTMGCLRSIVEHNTVPVKIIVADNGSRDDERKKLIVGFTSIFPDGEVIESAVESKHPQATLLLIPENKGYARGNNDALEVAYTDPDVDRLLILNNDILFTQDIIPGLIDAGKRLKDVAIVSPILHTRDGENIDYCCARRNMKVSKIAAGNFLHYFRKLRGKGPSRGNIFGPGDTFPNEPVEIELPSGSCMLIEKKLMQELGGFDPATFLYYEENILYKKIEARGLKNYLCPGLWCTHLGAATTSRHITSLFVEQCRLKSERYYVKNYSGAGAAMKAWHKISQGWFMMTFRLQKFMYKLMGKK